MGLGDDLAAPIQPKQSPCTFGRFIESSEYQQQLEGAIDKIREQRDLLGPKVTSGYTSTWLLEILHKNEIFDFSVEQIQRHVRAACSCARHLALVSNGSR